MESLSKHDNEVQEPEGAERSEGTAWLPKVLARMRILKLKEKLRYWWKRSLLQESPENTGSFTSENIDKQAPLCSECKAIFDNWHERDNWSSARPRHSHHHIVGLQSSARQGCPVCAMLLNGLSPSTTETLLEGWNRSQSLVSVEKSLAKGRYYIRLNFSPADDEKTTVHVYLSVNNAPCGKVKEHADDRDNWELIRKWLNVCQQTHAKCSQKILERGLPTRLIDVGDTNEELKICETHALCRETQYMTLSHCWGGKMFTTLTPENFQSYLSRIRYEDLSKTFKEAILITRGLGFRYLWIDSLCIKQGDELDWRHESARMGIVYSNSTLNIAASAAPDGSFGCFTARTPDQVYGCKVTIWKTDWIWDIAIEDITKSFAENALETRGWIFQETFLAPRTLYFTPHQLYWECMSGRACETFPDGFQNGSCPLPAVKTESWNHLGFTVAQKWALTTCTYSGKTTTFPKDRLIAISGIARLFATKFGTTYLAGLWKEDLIIQLAWLTLKPSNVEVRGSIPSWSWASVDTETCYPFLLNRKEPSPVVSILEATTTVVDDEFGDVQGGTIRIRCRLPFIAVTVKQHKFPAFSVQLHGQAYLVALYSDRTRYCVGQELYFLPLILGFTDKNKKVLCGLIIDPIQPDSYRRTGLFKVFGEDNIQAVLEAQKNASYEDKYFIGEASGLDEEGQKMCIITLI